MDLPPEVHQRLVALQAERAQGLPPAARLSAGSLLAAILREHLAQRRRLRQERAAALLERYWPVIRAVAAKAFQRCKGAVPLEELISAAGEEAHKAAMKFNPALGYSPAPYLRRWADFGCRALLRERLEQHQEVRPDQDPEGGWWERLGEVDVTLAAAPERAALREVLARWVRALPPGRRRLARLLVQGLDDDQIVARAGCTLADVDLLRQALQEQLRAQDLHHQEDELLTPAQAEQRYQVPTKALYKALASGRLEGMKREGGWLLRAADVRALARLREET